MRIYASHLCDKATVKKDTDKLLTAFNHLRLLNANEINVAKLLDERVATSAKAVPLQKFLGKIAFLGL